ncbi:MAG: glycosyltransferase family 2 protein [bacterium]|jgi:GT2 family glycosyltransferase
MMHPSEHRVAIILVNWNGYELTKACLQSIRSVETVPHTLIVVDNNSDDRSGEKLKSAFPEIQLIQLPTNTGFTGGNNIGIDWALQNNFDYILLLNNDTLIYTDFLLPMIKFLDENADYAGAQPKILLAKNRNIIWNAGGSYLNYFGSTSSIGIGEKDLGQYDDEKDTAWITGCAFLVRSTVVKEIGKLDDRFFAYYEDVDWSLRMKKKGYKLRYLPKAQILHVVAGSSIGKSTKQGNVPAKIHFYRIRNHLFLIRKHANPLAFILSYAYQTIKNTAFVFYFLVNLKFEKLQAVIKGHVVGSFSRLD